MKKLMAFGALLGGWYVWSNDLLPDVGVATELIQAAGIARHAGRLGSDDPDLDRIERMEADLAAQSRYLDQRGSELQALKNRVAPPAGPIAAKNTPGGMRGDFDAYNREVADLNGGLERYRRLFATYREEVERYNTRGRRSGQPVHRLITERGDYGIYRPVKAVLAHR